MRADRLLSIVMLLQTRGKLSAFQLASELAVSERTIYRDLEALSEAGVPVYAERGPGGGCALLDSYRTTLTGLTEAEVRALFMFNLPVPPGSPGLEGDLRRATLKLAAALPAWQRASEEKTRQRFLLDWSGRPEPEDAPLLDTLCEAVWHDQRLKIRYRLFFGEILEQVVDPYGLVAQGERWGLVFACLGRVRYLPVGEVLEACPDGSVFERPPDFDLGEFWKAHCAESECEQAAFRARVRAAPGVLPRLGRFLGPQPRAGAGPGEWVTLELTFESFEAARARLLGFGGAVEVLEPPALRLSLVDYARQVLAVYEG